ncbi:MAG: flagellar motor switch protein FliM [Actinomycetota bacterium]|nr:flagellar motor switch protein FliM [Actinomycetota bacterium]
MFRSSRESSTVERRAHTRSFDFRRPNKLNRDHLRNLQIIHETFSGQFSTMLSSSLRSVCVMTVESIEELSYDEYVRDVPIPSHMSILSLEPLKGNGILQLEIAGALNIVELMLGGRGGASVPLRPLSEIESSLIRMITDRGLKELSYAFENVARVEPTVVATESNPQFVQLASPSDMVVVVSFGLRIADTATRLSLCYPYAVLEPLLGGIVDQSDRGGDPAAAALATERVAGRINDAPVEVSVVFQPTSMRSQDILALRVGDVLTLEHPADALLTATVDDVPLFAVRPARKGKRVAAQVVAPIR